MLRILIIEDDHINRVTLAKLLKHEGHEADTASDGREGLEKMKQQAWDVILTDLRMPGVDGLDVLRECRSTSPATHVLVMTAYATIKNAVECLKLGAFNYLTKPFDPSELFHHLDQIAALKQLGDQNKELRSELAKLKLDPNVIGESQAMRDLLSKVKMVAGSEHAVLIQGASGTGKELIANTIQTLSPRANEPYIKVNCSALSETLFESEMFGHEKGAFTGAVGQVIGRFERASGGTILLDDIDDLSMGLQTKLLRVLQEGEIERVGGNKVIPVNVRILAATKVDLQSKMERNEFREDFYYRLNVVKLIIPSLADRAEDIPRLADHFLKKENSSKKLSPSLVNHLSRLEWPGNIRELQHLIQQMALFSPSDILQIDDLPDHYLNPDTQREVSGDSQQEGLSLTERVNRYERDILEQTLKAYNNNQRKVAEHLKIPRTTLRSKLERFDLQADE